MDKEMSGEKLELEEDGPCLFCGKDALDTGWECTECGADNRDWYYPDRDRTKDVPLLKSAVVIKVKRIDK